jgi:hypothetical protein
MTTELARIVYGIVTFFVVVFWTGSVASQGGRRISLFVAGLALVVVMAVLIVITALPAPGAVF